MRVQLFNPPQFYYNGMLYRMNPPLGLPILASVLQQAGHAAAVYDLEALGITPAQLGEKTASQRANWPEAMGFTCLTHTRRGVRECIQAVREAGYDGYVAVGGPHMSLEAGEALGWGADCAVTGECEGNITEIMERHPKGVIAGRPMAMADIPAPAWGAHTPKPREYLGNNPQVASPEGIAMWSRGCPHSCTFCGNPVFGHRRVRYAPPENVRRDMQALKEQGCAAVFVYDDELVGLNNEQSGWLTRCCEAVQPLGLLWKCQGRCNVRTPAEVYRAMHAAGCRVVMWGVESFHQQVLDAMRKGITEADIWATLEAAHEAGLQNWLFLMVGSYGEGREELQYSEAQIAKAVQRGLVQYRQVTVCTPVKGTPLYERAVREGWYVPAPEGGMQMNQVYNTTPWLTKHELNYWQKRLAAVQ